MAIFLLLSSVTALGWEVSETPNGDPLRFTTQPIHWRFDPHHGPHHLDPEAQRQAVERALAAWTNVEAAPLTFVADFEGPPQNVSTVRWEEDWAGDPDFLAVTSTYADATGQIAYFDLVLNGEVPNWTMDGDPDGMDLENTLVHEVGHGLGLAHSDLEEATMYFQTLPGDIAKRDLHADDEEAIAYLYTPEPEEESPLLSPFACASSPHLPSWLAVLLGFSAARRLNRSRGLETPRA
jgi:hypothetical protein